MSMSIRMAKQRTLPRGAYRGDSFLGDLAGAALPIVGGLLGGPAGAAIGGVVASGITGTTPQVQPQKKPTTTPPSMPGTGIQMQLPTITLPGGAGVQMGGISAGSFGPAVPEQQMIPAQGMACAVMPKGTHANKSSYYTSQGYVASGTKCVRNRRMNPLNPRALSRAMTRITSAKRAASVLGRITIRKSRGCGCK